MYIHHNTLPAIVIGFFLLPEFGFCDFEQTDSPKDGPYEWMETSVGSNVSQRCVFGNRGVAFRVCEARGQWKSANLSQCIDSEGIYSNHIIICMHTMEGVK